MRRKVADMMRLLSERRNKLKVTENVIDKKGNVVDQNPRWQRKESHFCSQTERRKSGVWKEIKLKKKMLIYFFSSWFSL
jgi:hypothetical protein